MPPRICCAASTLLALPASLVSGGRQVPDGCRLGSGALPDAGRGVAPDENPLLARFLQQQRELCSVPCLREDLQSLRRVGEPERNPFLRTTCIRDQRPATPRWDACAVAEEGGAAVGLSFADIVWANTAMRRMRIEAMFI